MIVNALRGRGYQPLKVLVYTMARHFNCSPLDIQLLPLEDFHDYLAIMKYDHAIKQTSLISDRRN